MFTIAQACTYLPTGMPCTIQAVFPDRHCARIVLANGQERDEVPWHDLAAQAAPIPTTGVPVSALGVAEEPTIVTPIVASESTAPAEPAGDADAPSIAQTAEDTYWHRTRGDSQR